MIKTCFKPSGTRGDALNQYLAFLLGIVFAGIGGELFVRGTVGMARSLRISPGIIAVTVAAFATSSPELSVAINAALAESPRIALGNVLGSNVLNVALILGLSILIAGIRCPLASVKRDFPVALAIPVVTGLLLLDGELSRFDGFLMLCVFLAWLAATIVDARKQRNATDQLPGIQRTWLVVLYCIAGLGLLMAAGTLIVDAGSRIATALGIDKFIIGATIVAVGTTVPELATTMIAKFRGHDEVGLGTVLGSNIFNGVFILGIAAMIHPIIVPWREVAIALAFGIATLAFTFPTSGGFLGRKRGVLLLLLYGAYIAFILKQGLAQ